MVSVEFRLMQEAIGWIDILRFSVGNARGEPLILVGGGLIQ